nr:putative uncharacterized protein DDB_G0282133 [Hydra vulgaris]
MYFMNNGEKFSPINGKHDIAEINNLTTANGFKTNGNIIVSSKMDSIVDDKTIKNTNTVKITETMNNDTRSDSSNDSNSSNSSNDSNSSNSSNDSNSSNSSNDSNSSNSSNDSNSSNSSNDSNSSNSSNDSNSFNSLLGLSNNPELSNNISDKIAQSSALIPSSMPATSSQYIGDKYQYYNDNTHATNTNNNSPKNKISEYCRLNHGSFIGTGPHNVMSNNSENPGIAKPQLNTQPVKINTCDLLPKPSKIIRPDGVVDNIVDNNNAFNDDAEPYTKTSPSGKPMKWYEQAFNPRSYAGAENLDQIAVSGNRTRNDILVNEMIYSDFNRLPPSFNDKDFEYGYSFLPPKDWYPLPPYPPVCVSSSNHPVQPVYLDTMTMDLKDWHETQKITPPDSINTAFITNELNSKV